nr:MAG TPA: major capsid protein [Caudoviricetes sp.]
MNLKALIEKRNALVEEINKVFETAEAETRALTSEEQDVFKSKTQELKDLDATIKMAKEARSLEEVDVPQEERKAVEADEKTEDVEARAFETLIRENRATGEMKLGENGAVIPTTIANRILDTVKQIAPLYALATKFNVKGKLDFPVAKEAITTAYSDEFTALSSSTVGFEKRTLDGFLVGALSKVSVSLINNSQFDIVNYVINKVAESIALFLEKEIISGEGTTKMTGVLVDTLVKKVETADDVPTADEFIAVQVEVPQQYQTGAMWLVSNKTLLAMRQMKDTNGRYFLQNDLTNGFGYTFLGKPVMVSDQMTDTNVVYGDFSGYFVNIHEGSSIKVLNEKYADEHAVGVVAWLEVDGKVMEEGKLVKTVKKTSSTGRSAKASE